MYAAQAGSLIEVVNKVGSLFYGTMLGAFILAIGTKRATGHGAFVGMLAGFVTVLLAARYSPISYLWYNVVGAVVVVSVGLARQRCDEDSPVNISFKTLYLECPRFGPGRQQIQDSISPISCYIGDHNGRSDELTGSRRPPIPVSGGSGCHHSRIRA